MSRVTTRQTKPLEKAAKAKRGSSILGDSNIRLQRWMLDAGPLSGTSAGKANQKRKRSTSTEGRRASVSPSDNTNIRL